MTRVIPTDEPNKPKKYWIGYSVEYPRLERQSKYDRDLLSLPENVMIQEEADYHYNRWDMEPVERQENAG